MTMLKTKLKQELSLEEWQIAEIEAGIAEVKAGKTIPHEEVVKIMRAKIAARMVDYREE